MCPRTAIGREAISRLSINCPGRTKSPTTPRAAARRRSRPREAPPAARCGCNISNAGTSSFWAFAHECLLRSAYLPLTARASIVTFAALQRMQIAAGTTAAIGASSAREDIHDANRESDAACGNDGASAWRFCCRAGDRRGWQRGQRGQCADTDGHPGDAQQRGERQQEFPGDQRQLQSDPLPPCQSDQHVQRQEHARRLDFPDRREENLRRPRPSSSTA